MTEPHQPGLASQAVRFVLDVANRRHALSRLVPVVLFLADAALCALVIWKIPCMFHAAIAGAATTTQAGQPGY